MDMETRGRDARATTFRTATLFFEKLQEKKVRGERSNEIGLPRCGFCSMSNPSPGTLISTPEFGCELFVAHRKHRTAFYGGNRKLFTAIHKPFESGKK
jgi:hypothetical protein